MALGTLISEVTDFLSKIVLIFALGGATNLANAYTLGNTIPNAVYDVLIDGILTSVVVPLLVKTARQHADQGDEYSHRMFTLSVLVPGAVTVVATLAAGLLVEFYASAIHGAEHGVMVAFAYFSMPQIFFYGMSR
jgi:putative peptidoglycan lipid II flippase